MKPRLTHAICLCLIVASFAFAAWIYPDLPEMVPSHWNSQGQVDDYMAKPWGAFLGPMLALGIYLMFLALPVISPHGFRMERFADIVRLFQLILVTFMSGVTVTTLLAARGEDIPVGNFAMVGTGALLLALGNYMGKLQKNFFIGIRTPWTLASDEVWNRTHRLGGWMFSLGGLVVMAGGFIGVPSQVLIASLLTVALVPVLYSFLIYRRIEGLGPDREEL